VKATAAVKGTDSRNAPGSNMSAKPAAAPKAVVKAPVKPATKAPAKAPVLSQRAKEEAAAKAAGLPYVPGQAAGTAAKQQKERGIVLDVNGQLQTNALEAEYDSQSALRQYQESAARRDLQSNLSTLDRDALEAYKTVADDYAGRGMLRSGGYAAADDKVYKNVVGEKNRMNNALTDLINNNQLTDVGQFEQLGYNKQNILNAYLTSLMANKTKKIGAV
jgi:hypothetical protein